MYDVRVLKDSTGPYGHRLTTFEVTFPRFILAEVNTHTILSRNSASSRAIPTETLIERVENDPFVPVFGQRVKGMGVGEPLSYFEALDADAQWRLSMKQALASARKLLNVDKSRANRLLEPFMWHTAIISGTEWANFFALRDHKDAQPEFQRLAALMRAAMDASKPQKLNFGEWHLPLIFSGEVGRVFSLAKASAGRCARVSYDTHNNAETLETSVARWDNLSSRGHWSPGQHPARTLTESEAEIIYERQNNELNRQGLGKWSEVVGEDRPILPPLDFIGNYRGFVQLRKHYPHEFVFQG